MIVRIFQKQEHNIWVVSFGISSGNPKFTQTQTSVLNGMPGMSWSDQIFKSFSMNIKLEECSISHPLNSFPELNMSA